MNPFVDAPPYIDTMLAFVFVITAGVNYVWIGMHGHTAGRWLQALGFTGLAMRLIFDLISGGDPHISAAAIFPLTAIAAGTSITAIQQMRMLWVDVRCMNDPKHKCFRSDRIKMALKEHK